jgi:hypothetical protein
MGMARLAFLTALVPTAKPDTGFEIANAAIIAALRAQGHEVRIIGFARPDDGVSPDPDLILVDRFPIENAVAPAALKLAWLATALRDGLPFAAAKLRHAARGRVLPALEAAGPFDAVVVNAAMPGGAFPEVLARWPALFVAHNVEHVSARQNAAHAGNPLMRWLWAREARLLERLERALCDNSRFVWTLAEEDRVCLAPRAPSAVLPLIHVEAGRSLPDVPSRYDVGLIGTWTWEPNLIGLRWFLTEVAPLLPAEVSVAVAGRTPDGLVGPPQVTFLGRVPDADAFLSACRVVALASRAGTGVQLKTIETFQLGLRAVATPMSLRGFAELPANVRVAGEAAAFAEALVQQVAAARSGILPILDGSAFVAAQQSRMKTAVSQGLATLSEVSARTS